MTKTKLTVDIEKTLYAYWQELGAVAVEEVTMPADQGIVDTLVMQQDGGTVTWRCFELKVTKADFHSTAKLSFIGHYNYFVLTAKLFAEVKAEIPAHIGVMLYKPFSKAAIAASEFPVSVPGQLSIAKQPTRQELQVSESDLNLRFISSLNREVRKAKQVDKGIAIYSNDQLLTELRKRSVNYDIYHPERNLYDQFAAEMEIDATAALQDEFDALTAELAALKLSLNGNQQ